MAGGAPIANGLSVHLPALSSPFLEGTQTPEWGVDTGVNVNEEPVLLAVDAGAAVERGMAAALPPPPPLPATAAVVRCRWRTDARRRRRALPTAFRQIFSVSSAWSRAALMMAAASFSASRAALRKAAASFSASLRIRLASACAALTICTAASVASCTTFAAGVECHSSIELRSAWLGMSTLLGSCAPVRGLVLFVASQRSMLARWYECH